MVQRRCREVAGQHHNIDIAGFYKEDHSAKTFERPAFKELLAFLKKSKGTVDLLLFLKWDRFSRNAGDAYMMINQLGKLGVEPQAIEQPLDLNIPENKIMLAFYLAAPEVENDRRSLNVIAGMRRAMKEGRYMTTAPKGYKNSRNELNKPIIVPGSDSALIRWVFEEIAKGVYTVKEIWRMARKRGLDIGRSNIWYTLRNPVYYRKIFIPAYKDEPAMLVQGIHEPIISEELFYQVQDILDGKKRNTVSRYTAKEELPLRGFLACPKCGRNLTGSASKGKMGVQYFYYHCISTCGTRVKAEEINTSFKKRLSRLFFEEEYITFFEEVMKDYYKKSCKDGSKAAEGLKQEIEKNQTRISNAQQLMVDGQLPAAEYMAIKSRYEAQIQDQQRELSNLVQVDNNLMDYVTESADLLRNVSGYYEKVDLPIKQKIVSSICVGKLEIDGKRMSNSEIQ